MDHNLKGQKKVVVFVHGFGVKRDNRGMFTDIVNALPKDYGWVLFDLYEIEGDEIYITPPNTQQQKIKDTLNFVRQQCPGARISLVAHSMGCTISAMVDDTDVSRIVFLAPAVRFDSDLRRYFKKYPGARLVDNTLKIPRKDGTTTLIPTDFFDLLQKIDAQEAIVNYSASNNITVIRANNDEILKNVSYPALENRKNISIINIEADHNFSGPARELLVKEVLHLI